MVKIVSDKIEILGKFCEPHTFLEVQKGEREVMRKPHEAVSTFKHFQAPGQGVIVDPLLAWHWLREGEISFQQL